MLHLPLDNYRKRFSPLVTARQPTDALRGSLDLLILSWKRFAAGLDAVLRAT
jgi:hypothetical protein